jgi:uncharacterized protein YodC (DUF2158 family)
MLGYARILNTTRGDLYENPLQAGDLVRLRSGGPVMTVRDEIEGEVRVSWSDKGGEVHTDRFPLETLKRAGTGFFGRRR